MLLCSWPPVTQDEPMCLRQGQRRLAGQEGREVLGLGTRCSLPWNHSRQDETVAEPN